MGSRNNWLGGIKWIKKTKTNLLNSVILTLRDLLIVFVIQLQKIGWVNLHHLEHGDVFDELEEKNIIIKNTDVDAYKIYENIMIEVLSKKIEEDKVEASKKAREKAKAEKEKKKKGKRD